MATSESRSPFRLPWSSDRSHEDADRFDSAVAAPEADAGLVEPGTASQSDPDAATQVEFPPVAPQPLDPVWSVGMSGTNEPAASEPAGTSVPAAPRKPTKLTVDLATAIRATTEAARDHALAAVEVDATEVTGAIRAASTEGTDALRRRSDEDLTGIKEWSKAEIARIRQETETRIAARKALLETEIAAYAAAVEHRIGEVDGAVARYRADMDAYFETLAREEDPARLATMAEAMPEPLVLEAWKDIADLDLTAFTVEAIAAVAPLTEPEAVEATDPEAMIEATEPEPEAVQATEPEAVQATDPEGMIEATEPAVERMNPWSNTDGAWVTAAAAQPADEADSSARSFGSADQGWDSDAATAAAGSSDPVDRDAIMAALEAAAEAVIAAEPAAEGAGEPGNQAEAAGDVPEPATDFDTQSFSDRLARLLPGGGEGDGGGEGEPRSTQIVVTGLVSVASIASFKRHLGRLAGVQAVGVASGPEGEFVFHVTHRPDVSFRDVIPSMPGFAARVSGTADGVVTVTARDPEAEG